jgi:predicted ArsR family transcriptional regulator
VTREEAAAATSISSELAAFHLDRLVDAGLLEVSLDRPSGAAARIGRAPKRYRVSGGEVAVSISERHHDFLVELLLDAFEPVRAGASPDDAVREERRSAGSGPIGRRPWSSTSWRRCCVVVTPDAAG